MDQDTFEKYLNDINALVKDVYQQKIQQETLFEHLRNYSETFSKSPIGEAFIEGEIAFYHDNYEQALKHYLQAKAIPYFQFFCYRTSACVALKREQWNQSLKFALNAKKILPDDSTVAEILRQLEEHIPALSEHLNNFDCGSSHAHEGMPCSATDDHSSSQERSSHSTCARDDSHAHFETSSPYVSENLNYNQSSTKEAATMVETKKTTAASLDELKDLLKKQQVQEHATSTKIAAAEKQVQANELDTEHVLEERIASYQRIRSESISKYMKSAHHRLKLNDYALYFFNGWHTSEQQKMSYDLPIFNDDVLLGASNRQCSNGYYLRWNGKGIVINPGQHFLDQFHKKNLHISDIDFVIVTQSHPDAYANIKEIYELNYQLNKVSPELKIIHYYLNQKAFLELSHILKPNFKQERNAIHSLELFVDSPDVEKIDLDEGITLNYFPVSGQDSIYNKNRSSQDRTAATLGIRFDLKTKTSVQRHLALQQEKKTLKIGYISGTSWSPLLAHHIGYCDVLLTGFGNTNINDFGKLNYNEDSLGYFGTFSLIEEISPLLVFCCEFDGREGDIRLETAKKLRQEIFHVTSNSQEQQHQPSIILPGDNGLFIDLLALQIECSVSKQMINPDKIKVVKSSDQFGKLLFLSPYCLL